MHEIEVYELAGRYIDGIATPEEVGRLQAALDGAPHARRLFMELCNLDSALDLRAAEWRESRDAMPAFSRRLPHLITAACGAACAAALLLLALFPEGMSDDRSHYDNHDLPITTVALVADSTEGGTPREIAPSTLATGEGETMVRSKQGVDIRFDGPSLFGFSTAERGALYSGSVRARVEAPATSFSVVTSNLRILDLGTAFRVDRIDDVTLAVTVLEGEVEVQSRVRLPIAYWPFDHVEATGERNGPLRTPDVVSALSGRIGAAVKTCDGLIGPGGLRFDDTPQAGVLIEGGTGGEVGLGTLSCVEGITIEALIVPRWSGRYKDYDTIYRKEDGPCRVLLSLQNDGQNYAGYAEPQVAPGPCLSFGLHLAGHGYRELDMPLDGVDGRPTLAELTDGRPHHVVATYDSFTGRKAISIDGRIRFEHGYPVGTLILSGGPAVPTIGNHGQREPFNGIIDEVAFYDFALTAEEIASHHRHVSNGDTFFGAAAPAADSPRWRAVTRLREGQTMTFDQQNGLPR